MSSSASPLMLISQRRKFVIYLAVLTGMFMASLDMQIVATALPTIAADLGNLELFGWVGAAYLLATAAVTPFYGKLGDLFGRKPVFMVAIALFVVGSLACGMAWSMESLIAARVLQGLGGGGLMTSAFGIIADLFEPRERSKYQGYSSAAFTLSGLAGPVAGGLISQAFGWQYIFLVNLPIGIAVIAVLLFAMPATTQRQSHRVDFPGGLLLAGAVTMLVFWAEAVLGGGAGGGPLVYILPILIVAAQVSFVVVERRAAEPIVPLHLLRNSTIALSLAISVVSGVATLGMLNYFALFLQTVTGLPPALAGLLFLPSSIGSLSASIGVGYLVARSGRYRPYPIASMALGIVVMLLFSLVTAATPIWMIGVLMFFFSVCIGLQMQTLMSAVQAAAPRKDVGAATGTITLARMIGASLGLAANGGILHGALLRGQAGLDPAVVLQLGVPVAELTPARIAVLPLEIATQAVSVFQAAFANVFYFGAGMFALGLVAALALKDVRLPVEQKNAAKATVPPQAVPAHE
ncbi:MAG: transporter [Devosia sp.]|nr:transporter [Devosia sp.]